MIEFAGLGKTCNPGTRMEKAQSRQAVLLVTTIGSFLTTFMGSAIIVGLPSIGEELKMDAIALSWVATTYLLSATIFLIPIGRIANMLAERESSPTAYLPTP